MVKINVSTVINTIYWIGLPICNCTIKDEIEKAMSVKNTFFNRPVKRLSKSTKPPAMIPRIKGIDCEEISKAHIPTAAIFTVIKTGIAAITLAFNRIFISNPYQNRKVSNKAHFLLYEVR